MAAPAANLAKFRLKVKIWVAAVVGRVALCSNGLAVFAGNYQRRAILAPQKYPIAGGVVKGRTAGQRQIRAGSSDVLTGFLVTHRRTQHATPDLFIFANERRIRSLLK